MELYLYKVLDDDNVLVKDLVDEIVVPEIKLKNPVDYDNPTLKMSSKVLVSDGYGGGYSHEIKDFNYAYIPEFEKYYFIESVSLQSKDIVVLNLGIDVLMTYKDDILVSDIYTDKKTGLKLYSNIDLEMEYHNVLIMRGGLYE